METVNFILKVFSILSFLIYGSACFYSDKLEAEFRRYGISPFRKFIGFLEVAGSMGLLTGFYYELLGIISALCLALLMFFAIIVRFIIRDPILSWLPAIVLFILNLYLARTF